MLVLLQSSVASAQATSARRPGVRPALVVGGAIIFGLGYAPFLAAGSPIPFVGPILGLKNVHETSSRPEGLPPIFLYGLVGSLAVLQFAGAALIVTGIALGGNPPSDRPQARLVLTPIVAPGRIGLCGTF